MSNSFNLKVSTSNTIILAITYAAYSLRLVSLANCTIKSHRISTSTPLADLLSHDDTPPAPRARHRDS
jgi:hypothetical protein